MGYGTYLRELLGPLGIYDLTPESLSGSELDALGQGLDQVSGRLDEVEREAALATAGGRGWTGWRPCSPKPPSTTPSPCAARPSPRCCGSARGI